MSSDERNLRLENAMVTLAEMAAQHNERLAATERSNQTLTEPTTNQRRRVARLKEALITLNELLQSHIERLKRRPRRH